MKALTIYQPWASLIMVGAKPYEFRGWNYAERFRGLRGERIVIHASTRRMLVNEVHDLLDDLRDGGAAWAARCLHAEAAEDVLGSALAMVTACDDGSGTWLRYGAGLGTAVLGEPRNGLDIAAEFGLPRVNDSDRDEHANCGWPMLDVEVWDTPIRMRGLQGFWNWPEPGSVGL